MLGSKPVQFHRRAIMALAAFPPELRGRIEQVLEEFALHSPLSKPGDIRAIPGADSLYLMRVGPDARAIFQETSTGFEVQDVVRQDTLRSFAQPEPASS